ncbi:hypothetical protein [Brevundimonas sp.]|uniref:hypothetical protein n=1 Tax=Brevundimonas sp. TaxID=1871086 RepID=UPI00356143EF
MQLDPDAVTFTKSALAYLAPFLLAALAGLGTLYKLERDKRQQIEQKLNENKAKIYASFVEDYSALFFKPGGKDHTPEGYMQIVERVQNFARNSLMYASDDVVEKFSRFYKLQNTAVDGQMTMADVYERLDSFSDVVIAIRKELGHAKTKLSYDTIGSLLVTDYENRHRPM